MEFYLVKMLTQEKAWNITLYTLLLCSVVICMVLHKYCFRRESFIKVAAKLPGPSFSFPFVGGGFLLLEALTKGYLKTWLDFVNRYQHPFHFWFFKQLWVIVSGPKDLEAVFHSENDVYKERNNSEGKFIAQGNDCKTLRSSLNPAFQTKLLVQFLEVMVGKSEELVRVLEPQIGKTINITDYTGRCMLDIICATQMGVNTQELEHNNYDFVNSSSKTTELIFHRMYSPHLHPNFIFKSTSFYQKLHELAKKIDNFSQMIVRERKECLGIFDNMDGFQKKSKTDQIYLDDVLTSHVDADERSVIQKVTDILVSGSDTTTVATGYAILMMGMYPEIQEKVYKEQCEIFQEQSTDITISTLAQMKYLEMVIKEVLRLYTVPGIIRKLKSPVKLENGVELPPESSVYMSIYAAHRNPKYWSHPLEFNPDHFLPENVAARPAYCFVPFSSGLRNCPGMNFGYLSMKTLLSTVARNYRIHSDLKMEDFKYKFGFMLELEKGYPVSLSRRDPK